MCKADLVYVFRPGREFSFVKKCEVYRQVFQKASPGHEKGIEQKKIMQKERLERLSQDPVVPSRGLRFPGTH